MVQKIPESLFQAVLGFIMVIFVINPDFDKICTYKITYPHFQAFSKNNL